MLTSDRVHSANCFYSVCPVHLKCSLLFILKTSFLYSQPYLSKVTRNSDACTIACMLFALLSIFCGSVMHQFIVIYITLQLTVILFIHRASSFLRVAPLAGDEDDVRLFFVQFFAQVPAFVAHSIMSAVLPLSLQNPSAIATILGLSFWSWTVFACILSQAAPSKYAILAKVLVWWILWRECPSPKIIAGCVCLTMEVIDTLLFNWNLLNNTNQLNKTYFIKHIMGCLPPLVLIGLTLVMQYRQVSNQFLYLHPDNHPNFSLRLNFR